MLMIFQSLNHFQKITCFWSSRRDYCRDLTNFVGISQIIQKMLQNAENLKKIAKKLTRVIFELDSWEMLGHELRPNSELSQT